MAGAWWACMARPRRSAPSCSALRCWSAGSMRSRRWRRACWMSCSRSSAGGASATPNAVSRRCGAMLRRRRASSPACARPLQQPDLAQILMNDLGCEAVAERVPMGVVVITDALPLRRLRHRLRHVEVVGDLARQELPKPPMQSLVRDAVGDQDQLGAVFLGHPMQRTDVVEVLLERLDNPRVAPRVDVPQKEIVASLQDRT